MPTSPAVTLTGTITDPTGTAVSGATVTLTLCNFGATPPTVTGSNVVVQLVLTTTTNGSGVFTIGPFYGNYQVSPTGTYYQWTAQLPGVNTAYGEGSLAANYQFETSGTFDISTITPLVGTSNPVASPNNVVFAEEIVPSGTINGTNATFTLPNTPVPLSSINLFKTLSGTQGGLRMTRGTAFTLSGNTVTFLSGYIPATGDTLICSYRYGLSTLSIQQVFAEVPSGSTPGTVYTLSHAPTYLLGVYYNGMLQQPTVNYSISGATITLNFTTEVSDVIYATYIF